MEKRLLNRIMTLEMVVHNYKEYVEEMFDLLLKGMGEALDQGEILDGQLKGVVEIAGKLLDRQQLQLKTVEEVLDRRGLLEDDED